ncbi:putative aminophospholipid-translocating P4-type ATPase [Maudiozyma humilis]|uniref:Phospholipid-transporting ATPase n=1 Tax=Maudiozyma humilis TaxID=51915 RepID=A0AAV5RXK4_MAUHU|nr:putative aminophospholipid-translocating P4-type ATPase [Kazachstania humilis]
MSFTPSKGSSKLGSNSNFNRRDRRDSVDSFDIQFNNSFDAALDNLKINNQSEIFSKKSISGSRENFEMASLAGAESFGTSNNGATLHGDNQPLMNNGDHVFDDENPRKFQSIPRQSAVDSFTSWIKNAFTTGSLGMRRSKSSISLGDQLTEREIHPDTTPIYDMHKYPSNEVSNAKYNFVTFVPTLLYEQFKFFYNLYFLVVALSQAVPALRIGYLSSYIVPLAFVLTVTMLKEAMDDIQRRRRDKESNYELYEVLGKRALVPSKDLKVGDIVRLNKGDRVPADLILLQSSEPSGESFIKTDQLDGETDWKLRIACPLTQTVTEADLLSKISLTASAPEKSIHKFLGKLTYKGTSSSPLTIDNTLWANTVVASTGHCIACVAYTGKDTRQAMNTTSPTVKTGLLELEINNISKILCACVFVLSVSLVVFAGFNNADWYVDIMRYLILFSTIIPVSLRVNLDLAKSVYAYQIEHDKTIPETIVRTSTIPEDLGRVEYLLSDKTGTLTQNDMQLKKIHLGTVSYGVETMDIVSDYVKDLLETGGKNLPGAGASRKNIASRVRNMIVTLAICHNVTPTFEDDEITYQAASPDEIAIVKFTESVGLSLFKRDRHSITLLHTASGTTLPFDILQVFPFNSDSKRMGIIVHDQKSDEYWFYQKGADTVMTKIVESNDWLEEETGNMAREGLRTLVIGRKKLTKKTYDQFKDDYSKASLAMMNRDQEMNRVVSKYLEHDLELLGLTGVEDKLQKDVKSSIELLRNAGIKIWMLTGDKVETARCVSISAKLIARGQYVHTITKLTKPEGALNQLEYLKINRNACLLIDGESLGMFLHYYRQEFFDIAIFLPTVVACRCTPQQKADVALIIRELTGKRVCCIGDGGNDVSMIQSADVGVGIVGKEGKQASLAADFSITQFCHLTELLLWHGRNSYKRSAKLAQFVMHRGLIIAVCQAVFSICSKFEPIALYQGWLMVGYATCYTMAPVFSLTLDHDIEESLTKIYPELYKDLTEGKSLSYKTFFVWCALSLYQGCIIQGFSQYFTGVEEIYFLKMVAISFTALVLNELVMVALEIYTWNKIMAITEIATLVLYIGSIPFLGEYFDLLHVKTLRFFGEVLLTLLLSVFPVWATKAIYRGLHPPSYAKVQEFSAV